MNHVGARHHIPWVVAHGCCAPEIENLTHATYDWKRLGIDDIAEAPEMADLLIVAGWINESMAQEIKLAYARLRKPSYVLAIGACALTGSPYALAKENSAEKIIKIADILPVDIFVPGCPPRPESLIDAILDLQRKITPPPSKEKVLHEAFRHRRPGP